MLQGSWIILGMRSANKRKRYYATFPSCIGRAHSQNDRRGHDDVIKKETFSALLALCAGNSPVTGEFHIQWPVTRSFDVFFDLHLNKRLVKQSRRWWFETPSCSSWRHCNGISSIYYTGHDYDIANIAADFLWKNTVRNDKIFHTAARNFNKVANYRH